MNVRTAAATSSPSASRVLVISIADSGSTASKTIRWKRAAHDTQQRDARRISPPLRISMCLSCDLTNSSSGLREVKATRACPMRFIDPAPFRSLRLGATFVRAIRFEHPLDQGRKDLSRRSMMSNQPYAQSRASQRAYRVVRFAKRHTWHNNPPTRSRSDSSRGRSRIFISFNEYCSTLWSHRTCFTCQPYQRLPPCLCMSLCKRGHPFIVVTTR